MTFPLQMFQDVFQNAGLFGLLILLAYVAVAVGAFGWMATSIVLSAWRAFRRWQIRRELRVLRGGRPSPVWTLSPEPSEGRPTRRSVRSLRAPRGEDDAA